VVLPGTDGEGLYPYLGFGLRGLGHGFELDGVLPLGIEDIQIITLILSAAAEDKTGNHKNHDQNRYLFFHLKLLKENEEY
jgi:hypothetical protein